MPKISYMGRLVDAPYQGGDQTAEQNRASMFAQRIAAGIAPPPIPTGLTPNASPDDFRFRNGYGNDMFVSEIDPLTGQPTGRGVEGNEANMKLYDQWISKQSGWTPEDRYKPYTPPIPQTVLPPSPNVGSQAQPTAAPTGFGGVEIPGAPSLTQSTGGAPGNPLANMFPQGWQNLGDNYASLFGGQNYVGS